MSREPTPLLMTVDVEIAHDRDADAQAQALEDLRPFLRGRPTTFFTTADAAERFAAPLRALAGEGHEIGSHGVDHSFEEDYRRLPKDALRRILDESTRRIEAALGVRPRIFRGPRMETSADTQAVLRELGYVADLSVCSRRFDPFASSAYQLDWLRVGPAPYAPSLDSPFARAERPEEEPLTVIPLSGLGLPFVSGTLYLFGEGPTRAFAGALRRRAARAGAPLVYLYHSYEFVESPEGDADHRSWHHRLYMGPAARRRAANEALISHMTDALGCRAVTTSAWLAEAAAGRAAAGRAPSPAPAETG